MNTGYTHLDAILIIPALLLDALNVLAIGAHEKRLCASSLLIHLLCVFHLLVLTTMAFIFNHPNDPFLMSFIPSTGAKLTPACLDCDDFRSCLFAYTYLAILLESAGK
ncbi:hypothetical protein BJ741DRAFT_586991 [Chytriomyces cf. hyalinus JEL632]|nr:hypothetical protein BJ741DRAFT_586991 [Chytriomyces cf. hyalinus JEL632]